MADGPVVMTAFFENAPTKKEAWVEFKIEANAGLFAVLIAVRETLGKTRACIWALWVVFEPLFFYFVCPGRGKTYSVIPGVTIAMFICPTKAYD